MLSTPNAKGELFLASSLYDGLEDSNIKQVTTLLLNKEADPNVLIPSQGITPFHLVIGNDSETFAEEVTKLFLRHGGNPNVRSADGMTPVHVAAAWGRIGVLELLLASGGDPLLLDDEARSPFHYAFDEAHYEAITILGKYCGEAAEESVDPKFKIALDKVLVNNGGIVAEYAVSEDTFMTAYDIPAIKMPMNCINNNNNNNNNNNSLDNFNKPLPPPNTGNYVLDWCTRHANNESTISTTADESSRSNDKFVTVRRHQRCLPKRGDQNKKPKVDSVAKIELGERSIEEEKLLVSQIIGRLSMSLAIDSTIDESFLVQTKKEGEKMPRISSPKYGEEALECEFQRGKESQDIKLVKTKSHTIKKAPVSRIKHKTPLRINPKSEPVSQRKTPQTATKIPKSVMKTPAKTLSMKKEKKTPSRYTPKLSTYSADFSIVSKSPNLVIIPTSNWKGSMLFQKKVSPRTAKKTPLSERKTPTPSKIKDSFPRFIKQSDLRYQSPKSTPKNSPNRLRNSPKTIKHYKSPHTRTPNLTDSTKRRRKLSSLKREETTNSPQNEDSRTTPLNKTYSKDEFSAVGFSPDAEITGRSIDRKLLAKNLAIKLDDTMYDEDFERNHDELKKDTARISGTNMSTISRNSSINRNVLRSEKFDACNILAGHFIPAKNNIKFSNLNKNRIEISGVNSLSVLSKNSEIVESSVRHMKPRSSTILAGHLKPLEGSIVDETEYQQRNLQNLIGLNKSGVKISDVNIYPTLSENSLCNGSALDSGIHMTSKMLAGHLKSIDHMKMSEMDNEASENVVDCENPVASKILAGHLKPSEKSAYGKTDNNRWRDENEVHPNILGGGFCNTDCNDDANLISTISESAYIRYQKNGKLPRACLPSGRPNSKEIDNSLISSDGSSYCSDHYSRDITSDNSKLTNVPILDENIPYASSGRCEIDQNILPKLEFHLSQSQSTIPRFTETHLEAGRTCGASANISSSAASSSYESFVSVEEEYKYEDTEEGVILLERRFLITPASIPIVKSEDRPSSPSGRSSMDKDDSLASCASILPKSMEFMDSETLRRELTALGQPPGPITFSTHRVHLIRLWKLKKLGPTPPLPHNINTPKFSVEIERTLRSEVWMNDLSAYVTLEEQVFREFAAPDSTRRWREGIIKSSFNYILLDPRVTNNLPRRGNSMSPTERWRTFLSAIFYVGKGKRSRPYDHLYEANAVWNQGKRAVPCNKKISRILEIWKDGYGVVCLHLFQNTIPVEAYTREAAMIEVLGLDKLMNSKAGDYYGVAATLSLNQKRMLGVYLLYRAMLILLNEGERQLSPENI